MSKQIVEKGTLLKVLDYGYVRLIDFMGSDEGIVEAARMSTDKGFISWDPYRRCKTCKKWLHSVELMPTDLYCSNGTIDHDWENYPNGDVGLLDNLWRKKHATPFEMGELVIEVQAPLLVFREWMRHRTQSYNEFSARYAVMPNLHYKPDKSRIQKQSTANKQGSAEVLDDEAYINEILDAIEKEQQSIYDNYDGWVEHGLAREVARLNTPVSRYSKMRAKGNIRNWFQFLNLRMRPDAQYEIRQYANEVAKIISWLWPKAYGFFEEYDLYGAHFSRTELTVLREVLKRLEGFGSTGQGGEPTPIAWQEIVGMTAQHNLKGTKFKEFMAKLEEGGIKILS
jgi:thymidylate synthase (FAD)